MNTVLRTMLGTAILGLSTMAMAAGELSVNLDAKQVIVKDGKTTLKSVSRANSGDVGRYIADYKNGSDTALQDVVITIPVPAALNYTGGASTKPTHASLDGKTFAPVPLTRKVNGKVVQVPVSEYRAVRFTVANVPAKSTNSVFIDAKVR